MAEVKLNIECLWEKQNGDCSSCAACDDIIFGFKYVFLTRFGDKDTNLLQLCESCFESERYDE